ncbi:MAG: T9SS type A sorting domain-containing protein [Prevotellaceae bacterium]|nr:T9SS type A sorting domain-containing protein [Candidatus Minthosoma equi]
MRQLNNIYPRLLLCILSLIAATVAMGQEIVVPIKSITATPEKEGTVEPHTHNGAAHSLNNLLDNDANTTWIADQSRDIKILSFLQLRKVDDTDNGLRSWIELPYAPNKNTEIEVVFEKEGATDWKTEYIFGCGGLYDPGLSFGLLRKNNSESVMTNYYLYTNGSRHDKTVSEFTGKHTLKYSAISLQLDDEPAEDVSGNNLEGAHNLCFFYNPYADKSGARSFKGKIYSVKIRENGKLRYELVPAAEKGMSGLYDRISTDFFPFNAEGIDYVENTYTEAYSNTARIHVKIPLLPEPQSGYEWSNNLVKNGYLTTNDLSSLTPNTHTTREIVTIDNGKALKITSANKPEDQQDYYSQLFIKLNEQLLPGDKYYVSFDYKADKAAHVNSQLQKGEGQWYGGCAVSADFTTSWKRGTWEGTIDQPSSQSAVGIIALSLNDLAESNEYYITNIVVRKQNVKSDQGKVWSENLASTFTAGSSATVSGSRDDMTITYDGTEANPWDSQFIIGLSEPLLPNGKYYISFSYKASKANNVGSYLLSQTGTYDADISGAMKTLSFTENWQTCDMEVRTVNASIPEGTPPMRVGFNMNVKDGITYYLKNIVIKKQMDPEPEVTPANEPSADTDMKWSKNLVKNGNFKSDDMTSYDVWPKSGETPTTWSIVDGHDGGKAVEVISNLTSGDTWESNFNISLDEVINPNEKFYISFDYKAAEKTASIVMAYNNNSGEQIAYNPISLSPATTDWQTYTSAALTNDKTSAIKKLVLMLNESKSETKFYFTNIVIKKQISNEVPAYDAPATEINIRFKDLNESTGDQYTSRHLFSLGTYEEKILALTTNQKRYKYVSGGREKYTDDIRNNDDIFEATFTPGEITIGGKTYTVDGNPTWNSADALYLMGTHIQTNVTGTNPCSFIGQIYSATVKENGLLIYDLIPVVGDNGEYGFADKITGKFFGVDGCSGAGTDGRLGGSSAGGYGGGATETDFKMPFKIDLTTDPQVVRDFSITTALRDQGENPANYNNPDKWLLYASNDGNLWTKLSIAPPSFSKQDIDANEEYYLYNVEAGTFLAGANEWMTRASVTGNPSRFKIESNGDGTYKLLNYVNLSWAEPAWKYLFVGDNNDIWIDRNEQVNYDKWILTKIDANEGVYEISFQGHDGKVGTAQDNYVTDSRLYIRNDVKNTKWALVKASDYSKYVAADADEEPNVRLQTNGVKYKFRIKNSTESFTQYRLVVEKVIQKNNTFSRLRLGDLSLSTNYVFEHYHGRVYDESPTDIPENLRVGGTSGYQTDYKTSADDIRLNAGVTIQRTHEYEHVIYVLPGTTVNLTPFSDFDIPNVTNDDAWGNAYNYREQYIRWYDYNTDMRSNNLSFDPRNGHKVNPLDAGHFAWNHRADGRRTREGSVAKYTADANPTVDDNGVIDVIALEAANVFDTQDNCELRDNAYFVIKEPTLQWRHTFVIKDARVRADEIAANNAAYIKKNKITLMCPSETPFQYPLPCFEYAVGDGTGHPTDFYKKTGEGIYEPIEHYLIETERGDHSKSTTYLDFSEGKATVKKDGNLANEETTYSFKEKDGYNRVFYLQHPITNPGGSMGEYTIRIFAYDKDATDKKGIQLMEYDLKVLLNKDGYMVNAETLYAKNDDDEYTYTYTNQIPEMMDKAFGQPTTKIDFDEVKDTDAEPVGGNHYFKWPWQWENSSYGFGYEDRGDYNMYMVADHMSITPYHGGNDDDMTDRDVYDRKYYDNDEEPDKRGYFFYANAASDPSRMAVLNIGRDFCPNTKVYVSAWINECQGKDLYAETANVIFSFRGVKADGTETVLNSFVSGYVSGGWNTPTGYFPKTKGKDSDGKEIDVINHVNPTTNPDNRGKWMHVYYTFSTTETDTDFDHYIITLENNCTSSEGADYAIDDIRCYVRKPQMSARFMKPVCNGDPTTQMELYGDFDLLDEAFLFSEETNTDLTLNYCFLDREVYEDEMQKAYNNSSYKANYSSLKDWRDNSLKKTGEEYNAFVNAYKAAFNTALLKVYDSNNSASHGTLSLKKTYTDNKEYPTTEPTPPQIYNIPAEADYYIGMKQQVGDIKNIIFSCKTNDSQIKPGKRYILAISKEGTTATDFALEGKCSSSTDFEVPMPTTIKIDGAIQSNLSGMSYCANQRPEVDIDLNGIMVGGTPISSSDLGINILYDWYYGPMGALNEEHRAQGYTRSYMDEEKGSIKLYDAMLYFRDKNPSATQDQVLGAETGNNNGLKVEGSFTEDMLLYIKEMVESGRMSLYKDKAFATAHIYGESLYPTEQKYFYLTAQPIDPKIKDVEFCLEAINIGIKVNELTPQMKDGDSKVTNYPETMHDVPIRIGLKQLKKAVVSDVLASSAPEHQLWIPLRAINTVTSDAEELTKDEDFLMYLVDTDDPNVEKGASGAKLIDEPDAEQVEPPYILRGAPINGKSFVIGKVIDIAANKTTNENVCKVSFLKSFKFREGYWYTVKFHFKEVFKDGQDHPEVCSGDLIYTIKVVPEYQMWTGEVSRNWNDDRNWRRVTRKELLNPTETNVPAEYVYDGKDEDTNYINNNTSSFAPAEFTKVIIPAELERVPYMYNLREDANKISVHFTGAPVAGDQLMTTRPTSDIFDEIQGPDANDKATLDLDGQMFVITNESGTNTLGVTLKDGVRTGGPQDAFVVNNRVYSADIHVYAKFAKVVKAGVDGDAYTIQLCNADGKNYSCYGQNGYLNFQPTNNIVFALGLGDNERYGQDGDNLGLWRVFMSGDGIIIKNVGRDAYLNPSEAKPSSVPVVCQLAKSFSTLGAGEIYHQTSLVQFDMASIDRSDNDVACRPWYDHTCDQIHFNAGAEIMDQRYLYYNKAWCDIEVPVGTWQTVASPLMNIVAGDLYLPTASARQNTPLFEDITYSPNLNDRFKPAVFQHSWNKSMAKVYELSADKTSVAERNVGVKLDWSHVYNDVNVQYGAGQGFSIKVDVSAMPETDRPAVAKFRFPKADTQYTYYNPSNTDGEKKTETVIDGNTNADGSPINYGPDSNAKRPGRLSDLSGTFQQMVGDTGDNQNPATPTSYFLVGNPLMCWLNMEKFFDNNSQFEKKYWIATADGQRTALFTEGGFISTENNPKFLPPGVSFFVKLNNNQEGTTTSGRPAINVTPQFTADMMSYTQGEKTNEPTTDNRQNGAKQTRAASQTVIPQLSLNATDMNGQQSKAVLTDGTKLQHNGVETLFDSNMKNDIILYTTKNGQAQTIANITPGDTLPLITGNVNGEVKLQINGAADFDYPLYIIDSEEGTVLPLDADVILSQTTNGVRYYIASSVEHQNNDLQANLPRVTAQHGRITVYAPAGEVISSSQIFTTNGQCVDRASNITTSHTATLQQGIYIVKLQVNGTSYTYKLLLTSK